MDYRSIVRSVATAAALCAALLSVGPAPAQSPNDQTLTAGPEPVIRFQMRSGTLIVRTWDRSDVEVSSSAPVQARHYGPGAVAQAVAAGVVPIVASNVQTRWGAVQLPAESFAVPSLQQGSHDGVLVFGGDQNATVTLTVPHSTALLWANVGRGSVQISDFHGGAFVARLRTGKMDITNVSGQGYAEVLHGPINVAGSNLDYIRARTAVGNIMFENCATRQIQVTSVRGSIAYDNGAFSPGLARFETQEGNIALGVTDGVQISAHSSAGKIVNGFGHDAQYNGNATDAQATVDGGGPVVTANSQHGTVYLYRGSFKGKPRIAQQWRPKRPLK